MMKDRGKIGIFQENNYRFSQLESQHRLLQFSRFS